MERVPENPLVTRKLLFTKPFTLTNNSGKDELITDVPAVYLILQDGTDWVQLGDSQGKPVGQVEVRTGVEWNTRMCWKAKEPTVFYGSLDDATNDRDKTAFPKDLPTDTVFPALEIREVQGKQYVKIERPFPPAKVSARFPLWVMIIDHEGNGSGELGIVASESMLKSQKNVWKTFAGILADNSTAKDRRINLDSVEIALHGRRRFDFSLITGQDMKYIENVPDERIVASARKLNISNIGSLGITLRTLAAWETPDYERYIRALKINTEEGIKMTERSTTTLPFFENGKQKAWKYIPLRAIPQ